MMMSVSNTAMKPILLMGGISFDYTVSSCSQMLLQHEEVSCANEMSASEILASKQASKQASIVYNREIVRAKARSSLFAVGFIPQPMKVTGLFAFYSSIKL